jgi:hypothetical protein
MYIKVGEKFYRIDMPISESVADTLTAMADAEILTQERFESILTPLIPKQSGRKDIPKGAFIDRTGLDALLAKRTPAIAYFGADGTIQVRKNLTVDRHVVISRECFDESAPAEPYVEVGQDEYDKNVK